jgi:hypothetical protein
MMKLIGCGIFYGNAIPTEKHEPPGRDPNAVPPEYEAGVLTIQPQQP